MASTTDTNCSPAEGLLPSQPYVALHPHYGMLLGVAEFSTEQAYHRGKMRLHNAWLHGWGTVWGLGVNLDLADGEVAVAPGLGLDGRGRELHNDLPQCLHVGRWFAAHRNDADFDFTEVDGVIGFDAHVRIRHHACLASPVPALADSCSSGAGVAYSRVVETVAIELVPGLSPPRTHRNHLLRVLTGLDAAAVDGDGNVLPADQEALDARVAIAAAAPADRVATAAAAFHHIAVLDAIADAPAVGSGDTDDPESGLFPEDGPPWLVLADVGGIALHAAGDGYVLDAATVANDVRSVLLASASQQALGGALLAAIV